MKTTITTTTIWLITLLTTLTAQAENVTITFRGNTTHCLLDLPGVTLGFAGNTTFTQQANVNATCPTQAIDIIETNTKLASIEKNLSILNATCTLASYVAINGTADIIKDRLAESFEKQRSFYVENIKPGVDRSTLLEVNFTDCVSEAANAHKRANATATELDKCNQLYTFVREEESSYRVATWSLVGILTVVIMLFAGLGFKGRIGLTKEL